MLIAHANSQTAYEGRRDHEGAVVVLFLYSCFRLFFEKLINNNALLRYDSHLAHI